MNNLTPGYRVIVFLDYPDHKETLLGSIQGCGLFFERSNFFEVLTDAGELLYLTEQQLKPLTPLSEAMYCK